MTFKDKADKIGDEEDVSESRSPKQLMATTMTTTATRTRTRTRQRTRKMFSRPCLMKETLKWQLGMLRRSKLIVALGEIVRRRSDSLGLLAGVTLSSVLFFFKF